MRFAEGGRSGVRPARLCLFTHKKKSINKECVPPHTHTHSPQIAIPSSLARLPLVSAFQNPCVSSTTSRANALGCVLLL